jgi:hypothetical protein
LEEWSALLQQPAGFVGGCAVVVPVA